MVVVLGLAAILTAVWTFDVFSESDEALMRRVQGIFAPLDVESVSADSPEFQRIAVGRKLFFDTRLSKDGTTSCASCHQPAHYGTDPNPQSLGVFKKLTPRNTQAVLNLRYHRVVHWTGDRESLEDQAIRSFTDPGGLANSTEKEALSKLSQAGYRETLASAADALALYQRTLVTKNSAFDRFLRGDIEALTKDQKNGLRQFLHLGCVACHTGVAFGAKDMIRFGLTRDYWTVTGSAPKADGQHDLGRQGVTGNSNDRNVFKIPSLRNVAMTAPYFHDGSAKDLATAIRWMGELQLDRKLTEREVHELKSFLESLTGEPPNWN